MKKLNQVFPKARLSYLDCLSRRLDNEFNQSLSINLNLFSSRDRRLLVGSGLGPWPFGVRLCFQTVFFSRFSARPFSFLSSTSS